ncbi:MAG: lysine N(6)-hydroxylase/L-ornithine N(5)-oxygenase family protein [Halobaculum sp.]
MSDTTYDLLGIGLGPFNLGLAALADGAEADLEAVFLEQDESFEWHPGMLIEGATLEAPFLADLVSMADPTSEYSYLNYLHETDRLHEFYTFRKFAIPRREYNEYCKWVAASLESCRFSRRVTTVEPTEERFRVTAVDPTGGDTETYLAEDVVVGVGPEPFVPEAFRGYPDDVFHTSVYLDRRDRLLEADRVTVVGSGQSAGEVFSDLLDRQPEAGYHLDWITRSEGFFQLEESKLAHAFYTPEYTDYFYGLPADERTTTLEGQDHLYKGLDRETSDAIYDTLYRRSITGDPDVLLLSATEVTGITPAGDDGRYTLTCREWKQSETLERETDAVVLATGYHRPTPAFLDELEPRLERDETGRYDVRRDYRIPVSGTTGSVFVQNGSLHDHGMNVAHLGLAPHRNSRILNSVVGEQVYDTRETVGYQRFGVESVRENA